MGTGLVVATARQFAACDVALPILELVPFGLKD
jgi:hypothetical protein